MSSPPIRIALAIAFALFGCTSDRPASVQGGSVNRLEPDAIGDASETTGDASTETTVALTALYSPAAAGLCAGAPAEVSGSIVWVDAAGLWLAPPASTSSTTPQLIDSFAPGEEPRSPLVVVPFDDTSPAIIVAVASAASCELRLFDRLGRALGAVSVATPQCTNPSGAGRYIVWPVGTDANDPGDSGRIAWIHVAERREVASLAIGGVPLTPAALIGTDGFSGGGSHWLVGTTRGLVVIDDPLAGQRVVPGEPPVPLGRAPSVVARWELPAGRVSGLVVAGDHAIVTLAADGVSGLGKQLVALKITHDSEGHLVLVPLAAPIAAPGPLTAHPVAYACALNDARSWFCPRDVAATVIAGGDGWIAGWHLPSGERAFEREVAMTWTGISLGRGGWVAGGGSHWLPGPDPVPAGWRLVAFDPSSDEPPTELASGPEAGLVPSPLIDSNGVIATPILGATGDLIRTRFAVARGGLDAARGPSRPIGDARNTGAAVPEEDTCADGSVRKLAVSALGDETISSVLHQYQTTVVIGRRADTAFIRWLYDGRVTESSIVDANSISYAVVQPSQRVAIAYADKDTGELRSAVHHRTNGLQWSHPLTGLSDTLVGLVPAFDGVLLAASREADLDHIVRVEETKGVIGSITIGAAGEPHGLTLIREDNADGAYLVSELGSSLALRHLVSRDGAQLVLTDEVFLWQSTRERALAVDASVDSVSQVRVLVAERDGAGPASWRLLHYDPALTLVDERPLPWGGQLATQHDGSSLIINDQGLARLSPGGALGPLRSLVGGTLAGLAAVPDGISAVAEGGYLFGFVRTDDSGRTLIWGRADVSGFTGCAEAGQCSLALAIACDTAPVCASSGCVPATGDCEDAAGLCEAGP